MRLAPLFLTPLLTYKHYTHFATSTLLCLDHCTAFAPPAITTRLLLYELETSSGL